MNVKVFLFLPVLFNSQVRPAETEEGSYRGDFPDESLGLGVGSTFTAAGFIFAILFSPFGIPDSAIWLVAFAWTTVWLALGFGVAGAIGGACLGLGWRVVLRSAAGFAIGGVAGAVALAVAQPTLSRLLDRLFVATNWWDPSTANFVSLGLICMLVPYIVGGALLGRTLASRQAASASRAG